MRHFYKLSCLCVSAVLFAACSGASIDPPGSARLALPNIGTQPEPHEPADSNYKILTSFKSTYAGRYPNGGLLDVNGGLYGTTEEGGTFGLGNVFSITTNGKEKVLHSFTAVLDGVGPQGTFIDVKGTLYGMTPGGGAYGWGTVYGITTSGAEKVLHNFGAPSSEDAEEGISPVFVYVGRRLYGLTNVGGKSGSGTVFTVTTNGVEKVLYSFYGPYSSGASPAGGLLYLDGLFYGTTTSGGTNRDGVSKPPCFTICEYVYGTVFSVTKAGTEKALVTFVGSNGGDPEAGLTDVNGTLYGTTSAYYGYFEGTVFSITTSGYLKTLHKFGSAYDGNGSVAPLLNVKGTLYGTTSAGGAYGEGTVFSVSITGNETVLHSFGYGSDGATPLAGLIDVKGKLYGTTSAGGAYNNGTVFALKLR